MTTSAQDLRVLPGRYVIEHAPGEDRSAPPGEWLAVVAGPDGRTCVRRDDEAGDGGWVALWSGDHPHDPLATGMLAAIVGPLAAADIPVMALATFHADLVLVPAPRLEQALTALEAAGHRTTR